MEFKNVFFRKMTILYGFVISLLAFELFVVGHYTIETKTELDEIIKATPIVLKYETEQKTIKGAEIKYQVKDTNRIVKVDESLSGNQCVVYYKELLNNKIGDEFTLDFKDKSCVIKDFGSVEMYPFNVYVSQELYDSLPDTRYCYLVSVNGLSELNRIEKEDIDIINTAGYYFSDYYSVQILYEQNLVIIGITIIALTLMIVVLFVNTSLFIKNKSKKSKKKKKDNIAMLNIQSSTTTITLALLVAYGFYLLLV